jgi:hypothetical protein
MAKRIIDLGVTKEMLTGDNFPEIKVLDKCYVVDDRQATWDKVQKVQNDAKLSAQEKEDKIYELTLGKEAYEEIKALNLPVTTYRYFTFCVMAAITGEDPKDLERRALAEAKGKN